MNMFKVNNKDTWTTASILEVLMLTEEIFHCKFCFWCNVLLLTFMYFTNRFWRLLQNPYCWFWTCYYKLPVGTVLLFILKLIICTISHMTCFYMKCNTRSNGLSHCVVKVSNHSPWNYTTIFNPLWMDLRMQLL